MFECFKNKSNGYGEGEDVVLSWGFINPHTSVSGGAVTHDKTMNEYKYGLHMLHNLNFPFETRDEGGVAGACKRLKKAGVTATIETHFNGFNGKASGAECLVLKGDSESEHYARLFMNMFSDVYPRRKLRHDRGIKLVKSGDRGYTNLKVARRYMKVAILSELFFGDNPSDFMSFVDQSKFWHHVLTTEK